MALPALHDAAKPGPRSTVLRSPWKATEGYQQCPASEGMVKKLGWIKHYLPGCIDTI